MKEVKVVRYEKNQKPIWDDFISKSKNGVFLFYRDYMDYHSDRFTDYSITFFNGNRVIAVMPANIKDDILYSHGGLTFGGIISDQRMTTPKMLEIFNALKENMEKQGIKKIIYKAIPHIYFNIPAEEDMYALFIHDAKLIRRDVSSTIFLKERIPFTKKRRWSIKKSKTKELEVRRSYEFDTFMAIEEDNLQRRYGVKPTHSTDEIKLLASRFPENIKLFIAFKNSNMIAGVIVYESKDVAHTQYITATDEGKKAYATDFILDFLINDYYVGKKYFDFGISTEKEGRILNKGLITQKEEFGARSIMYDFYEIDISKSEKETLK